MVLEAYLQIFQARAADMNGTGKLGDAGEGCGVTAAVLTSILLFWHFQLRMLTAFMKELPRQGRV